MGFLSAYYTDVGIKKSTNQDSLYLAQAQTLRGDVLLAVICDGMGGLAEGELASAELCKSFAKWFNIELPMLIKTDWSSETLRESWEDLLDVANRRLLDYSEVKHIQLGTTVAALLLLGDEYFIVSVGDTRIYLLSNLLYQLTKDQTVVQREIDLGMLTEQEAETDPRRNVLLQCVGASNTIETEFLSGVVKPDCVFMLCSDGYRHEIKPQEFWEQLNPSELDSEQKMSERLILLTEMNKQRQEQDNITALTVRAI